MPASHIYKSCVSKRAKPALEQWLYLESTLVLKFKGQQRREGTLEGKGDVEGTNERRQSIGEGMKKRRKEAVPVCFATPWKMFSSHKIHLVSAYYLESVT